MRFLLTIGGAGAQKEIFAAIIKFLMPYIKENKAVLYINVGDYKNVWDSLVEQIPQMKNIRHSISTTGMKHMNLQVKHYVTIVR